MRREDTGTPAAGLRRLLRHAFRERASRSPLAIAHPFPAPLSPRLVAALIEASVEEGAVVLDPMAGSGVVPRVATALGRRAIAFDVDPLSRWLIRVHSNGINADRIRESAAAMHARAARRARRWTGLPPEFAHRFDAETAKFIRYWFPVRSIRALLALALELDEVGGMHGDALRLAFSRTIIAKSSGASWALDLPHTRPHRRFGREIDDPLSTFPRHVEAVLRATAAVEHRASATVRAADARSLPLPEDSVDLVITSSPYANAIDYMRSHKFTLVWTGYSLSDLRKIRSSMIGTERGYPAVRDDRRWLEPHLPAVDGARLSQSVLRRFFYDMDSVLKELHRVLRPGGACVLVVGSSRVGSRVVDTPRIVARLGRDNGFHHIATRYRSINPHRRSLPFPSTHDSPLRRRMVREAIVGLAA